LDHNFHPQVSAVSSGPSAAFPREPVVGIQHNIFLSQFEAHISRRMAGYPRYGTRGSAMWLLCTRATARPGRASVAGRGQRGGSGPHPRGSGRCRPAACGRASVLSSRAQLHAVPSVESGACATGVARTVWRARIRLPPGSQEVPANRQRENVRKRAGQLNPADVRRRVG
jgi:hypothetical protein